MNVFVIRQYVSLWQDMLQNLQETSREMIIDITYHRHGIAKVHEALLCEMDCIPTQVQFICPWFENNKRISHSAGFLLPSTQ